MNNIFLGICLFLIATLCGCASSLKYSKRTSFFKNLRDFNSDFISSISFSMEDLFFLLEKDYDDTLLQKTLRSVIEVIRGNKKEYEYPTFITVREREELNRYFKALGMFDAQSQIQILNRYEKVFDQIIENCKAMEYKEGHLCKKIGIILGIMTFVIVV